METCKHIRSTMSTSSKTFFCKECKVFSCKSCVKEDLWFKQCGSCGQQFSKDDLTVNTCSNCKRCPFCKVVVALPDEGEVRGRMLRRCSSCNYKFGEDLMSEATYNNIRKIKSLVSHYRSFEHEAAGDSNYSKYWNCQIPSASPISEAREVSELDNCIEYLCQNEFNIDCFAPLKQRMQVPIRQDELTCQLAPVSILLQPRVTYYCTRCDNRLLTTDNM